jgi:hypothetical protein
VNLDDNFPDHPKVDGLSDGAFRLQVAGICYAHRHLTDGIIPADKVSRLVPRFKRGYVDELVRRMVWVELDGGSAYAIHDFLDWNDSREKVEEYRRKQSLKGRKGAESRWADR